MLTKLYKKDVIFVLYTVKDAKKMFVTNVYKDMLYLLVKFVI